MNFSEDKLFLSKPLSIMARELGFYEPCMKGVKDGHSFTTNGFNLTNHGNTHDYTLPLYQQVKYWLISKHGILVNVDIFNIDAGWSIDVKQIGNGTQTFIQKEGDYYEALEKGIKEAFKLINTEEFIYKKHLELDDTKQLKFVWRMVDYIIRSEKDMNKTATVINYFINKHNENNNIQTLRMLLNVIKEVVDEPNIIPVKQKLIEIIEKKWGKIY